MLYHLPASGLLETDLFQTLHDAKFNQALQFDSSLNDHDLNSGSQLQESQNLFSCSVVKWHEVTWAFVMVDYEGGWLQKSHVVMATMDC